MPHRTEPRLRIISFGFLHAAPPADADPLIDVRPFRDPHIDPALREMTARDQAVIDTVLATPGIREQIADLYSHALGELAQGHTPTIAVGCSGGRHRVVDRTKG